MVKTLRRLGLCVLPIIIGCSPVEPEEDFPVFNIRNSTSSAIERVHFVHCTLGVATTYPFAPNEVIQPGTVRALHIKTGCWNVRAEAAANRFAEKNGVELERGETFEWTVSSFNE